jgi:type IV pilus assembly protein PilM
MKHRTVGLDIGTVAIRGAEIVEDRHSASLKCYAERPLPAGVMAQGALSDPDVLRDELKAFWKEAGFKTRRVALAVGGPQIVVRTAELADSEAHDEQQLLATLADLVPMPLGDAIVDTLGVDSYLDSDGRPMLRILVVAAPRELVESLVAAVLSARLIPARVDLAPIAAARAVASRHASIEAKAAEIVIDLGATTTSVVVTADGLPRMVRILPGGAAAAMAELQRELSCSAHDAVMQSTVVGIASEAPHQPQQGISGVLERGFGPTIAEIARSIEYYRGTADAATPTRAVIIGGGARVGGIRRRLEAELGVPVVNGSAFANLADAPLDPVAELLGAVAVGAGIER